MAKLINIKKKKKTKQRQPAPVERPSFLFLGSWRGHVLKDSVRAGKGLAGTPGPTRTSAGSPKAASCLGPCLFSTQICSEVRSIDQEAKANPGILRFPGCVLSRKGVPAKASSPHASVMLRAHGSGDNPGAKSLHKPLQL